MPKVVSRTTVTRKGQTTLPKRIREILNLLRYFTKDGPQKAEQVLKLLKKVERNEEKVITSPLVIFEIVFTLETYYQVLRVEIKSLVQPILDLRGLKVDLKDVFESALGLYLKKNISFADAFNACFMKRQGIKEIYSYDEDFDRMGGISRIAPGF